MKKTSAAAGRKRPQKFPYGICRVCLCTDDDAEICGGACSWQDESCSLCSACVDLTPAERREKRGEAMTLVDEALEHAIASLDYAAERATSSSNGFDPAEHREALELVRWRVAVAARYPADLEV